MPYYRVKEDRSNQHPIDLIIQSGACVFTREKVRSSLVLSNQQELA